MVETSGSAESQESDSDDEDVAVPRAHTLTTINEKYSKETKSNIRKKPSSDSGESEYNTLVGSPEVAATTTSTTAADIERIRLLVQLAQVEANLAADEEKLAKHRSEQKMDVSSAAKFQDLRARREEKHEKWEILRMKRRLSKQAFQDSKS